MFWKKKDKNSNLPFRLEYDEDRRTFYRVQPKKDEPLFLHTRGKRYPVLDVSAGGVAFKGAGFDLGERISAVLMMPPGQDPIPMVLKVVKVVPGKEIAGEFQKIKDRDRERVHLYVLKRQKQELEKRRKEKLLEAKEEPPH